MLQKNLISPSKSPWVSPIFLVKKKNGTSRFCVDYRRINAVTRKDTYPLPCVDDILETLAGSQLFSTLILPAVTGMWKLNQKIEKKSLSLRLRGFMNLMFFLLVCAMDLPHFSVL